MFVDIMIQKEATQHFLYGNNVLTFYKTFYWAGGLRVEAYIFYCIKVKGLDLTMP